MSVNNPASSHTKGGPHPIYLAVFCFFGLVFWLIVVSSQIQATEHIVNHRTGLLPTWDILQQWRTVWGSSESITDQAAFMVGWGIEIFVLFLTTAYEVLRNALQHSHPLAMKLCGWALFGAWIVDFFTDLAAFSGLPTGWRIICALLEAAIVAFLGVGCINGLFDAWKRW